MSKTLRQRYDARMVAAKTLPPTPRKIMVDRIISDIRRDREVKPLVLCAFLQDHAALIREAFNPPLAIEGEANAE